jgi:hypothetical protein
VASEPIAGDPGGSDAVPSLRAVVNVPLEPGARHRAQHRAGRATYVVLTTVLIAVAGVLIAYSAASLPAIPQRTVTATTPANHPAPSPAGVVPPPATGGKPTPSLQSALMTPPPPWVRVSDSVAHTGPLDLDAAAALDGGGKLSRAGLLGLGFQSGITRAWQAGDGQLLVLAYTFKTPAGAMGYLQYAQAARNQDSAFNAEPVTGVPDAIGYRSSSAAGVTEVVLLARGRTACIVGVQRPSTPELAEVDGLAKLQYDTLGNS